MVIFCYQRITYILENVLLLITWGSFEKYKKSNSSENKIVFSRFDSSAYWPNKPNPFDLVTPVFSSANLVDGADVGGVTTTVTGQVYFIQTSSTKDILTFVTLNGLDVTGGRSYNLEVYTTPDVVTPNCAGTGPPYNVSKNICF